MNVHNVQINVSNGQLRFSFRIIPNLQFFVVGAFKILTKKLNMQRSIFQAYTFWSIFANDGQR